MIFISHGEALKRLIWGLFLFVMLLSTSVHSAEAPQPYSETIQAESGETFVLEMVGIPGGTFRMGSPEDEPGRNPDEGPQHPVELAPFYLSAKEIQLELFLAFYRETMTEKDSRVQTTEAEVDAVSGPTPVYGDLRMGRDLDHPAFGMTWQNAVRFCEWLSEKTGQTYRLPTEAEWEYACRGGTPNVYGSVNDEAELEVVAWFDENSDGSTQSAGTRKANAWGLYDMSGNVREWVHDFYNPQGYAEEASNSPSLNPTGPSSGRVHVARGGDYSSFPEELRCAARAYEIPDWRALDPQLPKSQWWLPFMDFIGFRVARSTGSE